MTKDLLAFIRTLSENDKKILCQKVLKTTEEVGELAKAVLPFENAAGTLHRFSDRKKILDNVVDVALSALSIAYDLKFSDEEIEEMMLLKSKKWQGIQAVEDEIEFPLPYEIHVSIERPKNIDRFKIICQSIGVKPIVIDLEKNDELVMQDVMTSSVHYGDNRSAYEEAKRIGDELEKSIRETTFGPIDSGGMVSKTHTNHPGYNVLRTKIETVPWHPAAPSIKHGNSVMPEDCYFESHIRIIAKEKDKRMLAIIARMFQAHLSRNFFKKLNNEQYIIMMTLRSYVDTYENFKSKVNSLHEELLSTGFTVDKLEIEFAIYDTKISHDYKWLEK